MDDQQILDELLALLEGGGVVIRRDELGGSGGGICEIRGKITFFVDMQAATGEMAAMAAEAVAETLNTEDVYIRPEIRRLIESKQSLQGE
jgi:hypothetical protein